MMPPRACRDHQQVSPVIGRAIRTRVLGYSRLFATTGQDSCAYQCSVRPRIKILSRHFVRALLGGKS